MYYYKIGDKICCSFNGNLSYEKAEMPHPGTPLTFLFEREPGTGRDSFKVNSPLLLFQEAENVSWLSSRKLEAQAAKKNCELDEAVEAAITQDVMRAVNRLHPDFETILAEKPQKTKKRVHVLAIGAPRPGFEGGQMPLYRRLPKRGFTNRNSKTIVGINVSALERFENDTVVTVETLIEAGIVKNPRDGVKILGNGELTKKLNVKVDAVSEGAKAKIEAVGGTCEVI